jgi:hypothetical protein
MYIYRKVASLFPFRPLDTRFGARTVPNAKGTGGYSLCIKRQERLANHSYSVSFLWYLGQERINNFCSAASTN